MLLPQINWIKNISCNVTWQRLSLVCRWVMGESASTHDPSKKLTHLTHCYSAACSSRGYIAASTAVQQWGGQSPGPPRVPGPKNNAHMSPVQSLELITIHNYFCRMGVLCTWVTDQARTQQRRLHSSKDVREPASSYHAGYTRKQDTD